MPIVAEQTATVAAYSGWSNRETWIMNLWLRTTKRTAMRCAA